MKRTYKLYEEDEESKEPKTDSSSGDSKHDAKVSDLESKISEVLKKYEEAFNTFNTETKEVRTSISLARDIINDKKTTEEEKQNARNKYVLNLSKYHQSLNAYYNKVAPLRTQFDQIQSALSASGENPDPNLMEMEKKNLRNKFSKELFESVRESRVDEMKKSLISAMDSVKDLSYYFDETACRTFARRIIVYINNDKDFRSSDNKKELFNEFVNEILTSSQKKLQKEEAENVVSELDDILSNNIMFEWIFNK